MLWKFDFWFCAVVVVAWKAKNVCIVEKNKLSEWKEKQLTKCLQCKVKETLYIVVSFIVSFRFLCQQKNNHVFFSSS